MWIPRRFRKTAILLFVTLLMVSRSIDLQADEKTPKVNRLAKSASPYLLQHAHNPVDWYPWGTEAFERAKKENKPIFLSVGYSACHWCHVMERESFSDPAIAKLMNDTFVCVKVDREERPDVDAVYMAALQAFSGGGGWPMNMMINPDGRPFFGMTYMAARDKDGDEGFETLIKRVRDAWRDNRKELDRDAENLSNAARRIAAAESGLMRRGPIQADLAKATLVELAEQFDPNYGGFGSSSKKPKSPKFPEPGILLFLWDMVEKPEIINDKARTKQAREMALTTMDNIARGGIRDHLRGGIHRYSTDRYWTVPHFEKMLYDNALWLSVASTAFARTGDDRWKAEVNDTISFIERDMTQPGGGFDSSLDADTEGQEGATYLWLKSELETVLKDQPEAALFKQVYGLNQAPNFENRDTILAIPERWTSLTGESKLTEPEIRQKLLPIKQKLADIRQARKQPSKDDKCLTSWTGLTIAGLADANRLTGHKQALEMAKKAAAFLLDKHSTGKGLRHVSRGTVYSQEGPFLEDYAYLIYGLVKLHQASGEPQWLGHSKRLASEMIAQFEDQKNGGFFETNTDSKDLFVRPRNWFDNALPSPAGLATLTLVELAELTGDKAFMDSARRSVEASSGYFSSSPDSVLSFVRAAVRLQGLAGDKQTEVVAVTGDPKPAPKKLTPVQVRLVDDKPRQVAAGTELTVEVELEIASGYHTYGNPSTTDSAKPTELTMDEVASKPLTLTKVDYPPGELKQLPSSGLEPVSIYEGKPRLKAILMVPKDASGKEFVATLVVAYQVCTDQFCLPPAKIRIPLKVIVK
jgi:uncharacterized protein YyaL (SSP411 family)